MSTAINCPRCPGFSFYNSAVLYLFSLFMVSDMHHQHNSLPRKNSDNLNKPDEITEYNIATR